MHEFISKFSRRCSVAKDTRYLNICANDPGPSLCPLTLDSTDLLARSVTCGMSRAQGQQNRCLCMCACVRRCICVLICFNNCHLSASAMA